MRYVDFAIAVSIFMIFFGLVVIVATNYFARMVGKTRISELRSKAVEVLDAILMTKGTPSNWEDYSLPPVRVGLLQDIYRIPVLIEESSGVNRTKELVRVNVTFDEDCVNATWNDTVRVYDEDWNESVSLLSDQTFCSSQFLKEANVVWEVNVSANERKKYYIYSSPNDEIDVPAYARNLTTVGYWKFDEGNGTITRDETANDNDGTISGATWTSDCKYDDCLSFDGSNDYVSVPHHSSLSVTSEVTVEAWVKPAVDPRDYNMMIVQKGDDTGSDRPFFIYSWGTSDEIQYGGYDGSVGYWVKLTMPSSYDEGKWSHLALVKNGSGIYGYYNGEFQTKNDSFTMDMTTNADPVVIGYAGTTYFFNGTIDEVKIWNRALTDAEINGLNSSSPLQPKAFPQEETSGISWEKLDALKQMNYEPLRKIIGENYKFRVEIG